MRPTGPTTATAPPCFASHARCSSQAVHHQVGVLLAVGSWDAPAAGPRCCCMHTYQTCTYMLIYTVYCRLQCTLARCRLQCTLTGQTWVRAGVPSNTPAPAPAPAGNSTNGPTAGNSSSNAAPPSPAQSRGRDDDHGGNSTGRRLAQSSSGAAQVLDASGAWHAAVCLLFRFVCVLCGHVDWFVYRRSSSGAPDSLSCTAISSQSCPVLPTCKPPRAVLLPSCKLSPSF